MPIYEYDCESCRHTFEQLVFSKGDERGLVCPQCGKDRIKRRPSIFAAHGASASPTALPMRGCGRCGDPDGPCGLD